MRRLGATLQAQWWQPEPTLLATLLRPMAAVVGLLSERRRRQAQPERLPVPVVVVGNLIVGGAGKTPTTIAVVEHLKHLGWQPGVVSRGHGRAGTGVTAVKADTPAQVCGDEPLLIHLRTGAPTWVGTDRVAACRALLDAAPMVDVIVSDDGLQHHRLHRDVQVIVFDERGVGNGLLLPAGPLREPLADAPPPRSVVLYNAPAPSTRWPGHVAQRGISRLVPLTKWWSGVSPTDDAWRALAERPVTAVAGIASPQRFFDALSALGLHRLTLLPLPDHAALDTLPWPASTTDVVITEKDAVKLPPNRELGATRVWVAPLDFVPPPAFFADLARLMPR
jgi:tetraacyldisaccharide 4'-kinase